MLESRRVAGVAALLLPCALLGYLAFNAGGFYPGPAAYAAMFMCAVLVLRMTLASEPLAGWGWPAAVGCGALGLYALVTLLSQKWSHAPGVALVEFDLPLLYLLVLVLFCSMPHERERTAWLLRLLAAGIVAICTCALITRLLPDFWPTPANLANNRLSFPLTYWNALGLLAAMGVVLCLHFAADLEERVAVRVLAAAAFPLPAATLYFTFSRGGIGVALICCLTYMLLGRPRALLGAVLAIAPSSAVALLFAYNANLLATGDPTTAQAVAQGRRVALVIAACIAGGAALRAAAAGLDRRLARFSVSPRTSRLIARSAWSVAVLAVALLIIAFNGTIAHDLHRFSSTAPVGNAADFRTRLTDPSSNGRVQLWRVAWHGFESAPLLGHGAGSFVDIWAQKRPMAMYVQDAHSLYMEVLDELGIVGLVLLVAVILTALVCALRHARGPSRPLYAAAFALMLAWVIHAGFDWDWEMPAVSIVFFVVVGAMLARGREAAPAPRAQALLVLSAQRRMLLGLLFLAIGVAPGYVWLSERKLEQAAAAFDNGNCQQATSDAESSISILGSRAEPYEILAYCDIRRDMPQLALAAIQRTISTDPHNYLYVLDLAVIRAAAGEDPVGAADRAHQLNPLDSSVQQVWVTFKRAPASEWQRYGQQFLQDFNTI